MKQALATHIIIQANKPGSAAVTSSTARAADGACCSPARYTIPPDAAVEVMYDAVGKPDPGCSKQDANVLCSRILSNEPYFILKAATQGKKEKTHLRIDLNIAAMFADIKAASASASAAAAAAAAAPTAAVETAEENISAAAAAGDTPPDQPRVIMTSLEKVPVVDAAGMVPGNVSSEIPQQQQQEGSAVVSSASQHNMLTRAARRRQQQQQQQQQSLQQQPQQQQQQQRIGVKRSYADLAASDQPSSPGMLLPMPKSLLLLAHTTAADCAAAPVHHLTEQRLVLQLSESVQPQQQSPSLHDLIQHAAASKVVGLDLEFAARVQHQQQQKHIDSVLGGNSSKQQVTRQALRQQQQQEGEDSGVKGQPGLAVVQMFVPAVSNSSSSSAKSWPACIYILEIPEQQAAADQLMHLLQPLLESEDIILVMHDAQQDSSVLQQQFGIRLRGLLDTQLLAGLTALASSSSSSVTWSSIGLGQLYELYNYPHPKKEVVENKFKLDAMYWLKRPLPSAALVYAANDVRYLLPIAYNLLQQTPAAAIALGNIQLLLSQQGADVLQLRPQMMLSGTSGSSNMMAAAAAGQQQQQQQLRHIDGLTKMTFELQLDHDERGGWFVPRFVVHLYDDHSASSSSSGRRRSSLAAVTDSGDAGVVAPMEVAGDEPAAAAVDHIDQDGDQGMIADDPDRQPADQNDDIDEAVMSLSKLLPERLQDALATYLSADQQPALVEISADKSKNILLRLSDRTTVKLEYCLDIPQALQALAAARQQQEQPMPLGNISSNWQQQQQQEQQRYGSCRVSDLGKMFGSDNRLGIPGTLHRISAMRDRVRGIYGLTYRVGRHVPGVALLLADVLSNMKASLPQISSMSAAVRPQNLLVLGQPGVGKTTLLRDIARVLSLPPCEGGLGLSVVIVDTSNEICGDSDVAHPCVGAACRVMVPQRSDLAAVMVEAVQHHNPDVVIVDDLGKPEEVAAARTISQRGVLLVGTAHGNNLSTLLNDPELAPLVGGVQAVTLGDAEARAKNNGQKVRLERAGAATFTILLELQHKNRWRLHPDVEQSVDLMLGSAATASQQQQQQPSHTQLRHKDTEGKFLVQFETPGAAKTALSAAAVTTATAAAAAGSSKNAAAADVHVVSRDGAAGQGLSAGLGQQNGIGGAGNSRNLGAAHSAGWLLDLLNAAVLQSFNAKT